MTFILGNKHPRFPFLLYIFHLAAGFDSHVRINLVASCGSRLEFTVIPLMVYVRKNKRQLLYMYESFLNSAVISINKILSGYQWA